MVRLGDARLWDDLSCVDVARGQVRQLVHSGKSSLDDIKKKETYKKITHKSVQCVVETRESLRNEILYVPPSTQTS